MVRFLGGRINGTLTLVTLIESDNFQRGKGRYLPNVLISDHKIIMQ
jgi:hypothetical protein